MNTRGVALYTVLAMLLIVVLLANAVLTIISSQSAITNHQIRRLQAFYAAQAATNYAREQLRINTTGWVPGTATSIVKYMCRSAADPMCPTGSPDIVDGGLPFPIRYVRVTLGPRNAATQLTPINASVNYTYVSSN